MSKQDIKNEIESMGFKEDEDFCMALDNDSDYYNYVRLQGQLDGYEMAEKEISPKILKIIESHFQAHKRWGDTTIETKMRFKDIKSDIIQLLNDALYNGDEVNK